MGPASPTPGSLKRRLQQLKRAHRAITRKQNGSKNRRKAARRLGRLHRTIAQQRANTLQQVTTRLAQTTSVLVLEGLQVAGMLKNHHLAQAIAEVGCSAFKRQLTYKAAWYDARVVLSDRS